MEEENSGGSNPRSNPPGGTLSEPPRRKYLLGSEKEETPRGDRLLGLQLLQERNGECEHVVVVGDGHGAATLAVKMRGQDVCPHCTRREAAYWRMRAKTAEGVATVAGRQASAAALASVQHARDHYAEGIFSPEGTSPECRSAKWARGLLDGIMEDIRSGSGEPPEAPKESP